MKKTWLKIRTTKVQRVQERAVKMLEGDYWRSAFRYFNRTITIFHLNMVVLPRKILVSARYSLLNNFTGYAWPSRKPRKVIMMQTRGTTCLVLAKLWRPSKTSGVLGKTSLFLRTSHFPLYRQYNSLLPRLGKFPPWHEDVLQAPPSGIDVVTC